MERASNLAQLQLEAANEILGRIGRSGDDDVNLRAKVALMQVLATNYASEVDKRKA